MSETQETETQGAEVSAAVAHVTELLGDTRKKMEEELEELRPQHEAFERLQQILANFDQITTQRQRKAGNGGRAPRGTRSEEFLNLVRAAGEEGLAIRDAEEMMNGVNPNYLYRLAKDLLNDNQIRKDGKKYFAVAASETPGE